MSHGFISREWRLIRRKLPRIEPYPIISRKSRRGYGLSPFQPPALASCAQVSSGSRSDSGRADLAAVSDRLERGEAMTLKPFPLSLKTTRRTIKFLPVRVPAKPILSFPKTGGTFYRSKTTREFPSSPPIDLLRMLGGL